MAKGRNTGGKCDQRKLPLSPFPQRLDEYIAEDNPVRVIDAFVDELDLAALGFERVQPQVTDRPGYHPASLLKIYVYLNRIQSSRRLERETPRNVEMMWLTGRLMPDFKTIADFRKDKGKAIRRVCPEFVELCRSMEMFTQAIVAIDGSKFKAVNSKDRNDTRASMKRRIARMEQHIERYLSLLDRPTLRGESIGLRLSGLPIFLLQVDFARKIEYDRL